MHYVDSLLLLTMTAAYVTISRSSSLVLTSSNDEVTTCMTLLSLSMGTSSNRLSTIKIAMMLDFYNIAKISM